MTAPVRGRVFDVQRFCVHDGPGIRTTVFLSGCSLRCAWCHNPESFDGAAGAWRTPEEVLEDVLRDRDFFETSGGGVTLSGGEPLLQAEFVSEVLRRAKAEGLHTCVQTAGNVRRAAFEAVVGRVDLFQFDVKHADPAAHRQLTGEGNERILDNLRWLLGTGAAVEVRMPLVPGHNDQPRDLARLATLLGEVGVRELQLQPYQRDYLGKYAALGLPARCAAVLPPRPGDVAAASSLLERHGISRAHAS